MKEEQTTEEQTTEEHKTTETEEFDGSLITWMGLSALQPLGRAATVSSQNTSGVLLGALLKSDNHWVSPYVLLELGGVISGDNYPITYMDGNTAVPTYAHVTYSTAGLRLGLSADFPVGGRVIPRAFAEIGFTDISSSISVPKPDFDPEKPETFFFDRSAIKGVAMGLGAGLALRWEILQDNRSRTLAFLEFSTSVWQTGALEYLYNNEALNATIRAEGEQAYTHLLSDRPHFNHDYYQGYRFKTPISYLSFSITLGFALH